MRTLIAASALALAAFGITPGLAQTGSGQFCLKSTAGMAQCAYQSMAQCEEAKQAAKSASAASQCVDRSQVQGTVGAGSSSPGSTTTPPASGTNSSPQPH